MTQIFKIKFRTRQKRFGSLRRTFWYTTEDTRKKIKCSNRL